MNKIYLWIKKLLIIFKFFQCFNDQGQGHLEVKVKVTYLIVSVLSQATMCASMNKIHPQNKKLWSIFKFFKFLSDQGQGHLKVKVNVSYLIVSVLS